MAKLKNKVDEADIPKIIELLKNTKLPFREIGRKFNLSRASISNINKEYCIRIYLTGKRSGTYFKVL